MPSGRNSFAGTVARYGHCNFEIVEMFQAFEDLVSWVDTGVKPTP